jgi:hypothetical protein
MCKQRRGLKYLDQDCCILVLWWKRSEVKGDTSNKGICALGEKVGYLAAVWVSKFILNHFFGSQFIIHILLLLFLYLFPSRPASLFIFRINSDLMTSFDMNHKKLRIRCKEPKTEGSKIVAFQFMQRTCPVIVLCDGWLTKGNIPAFGSRISARLQFTLTDTLPRFSSVLQRMKRLYLQADHGHLLPNSYLHSFDAIQAMIRPSKGS